MGNIIIDGHNDTLLKLIQQEQPVEEAFLQGSSSMHLDLPRALQHQLKAGFFAVFSPPAKKMKKPEDFMTNSGYKMPLPEAETYEYSHRITNQMIANLFRLERQSKGKFKVVRSVEELRKNMKQPSLSAILHMEGAEAIDKDLNALHVYHQAGLRSLGLVWSRGNIFAEGVPYIYPSSPDTGPGLTELGKKLVRECNTLGIMLDQSHMNERGFWDTAKLTNAPLVATHSNAHALCPISRNLTDKQLDAIAESNGVAGVTYSINMLQGDAKIPAETPIEEIVKHIQYIADRIGVEHVALGSDFDGTTVPAELKDISGVDKLTSQLKASGFDEESLRKITHGNWLRVLEETWK
ncbi:dipeptidase [Halobacillus rhizosphaerae]|uniref:dipeptidase n=1 Tax=Halobacillus rhizosphaerae TaxID=3064889 RepID=UPI00398B21AB